MLQRPGWWFRTQEWAFLLCLPQVYKRLRFRVFTAVTMKNSVFWDVRPSGFCMNRRFGGTYRLQHQGDNNPGPVNVGKEIFADSCHPDDRGITFLRNIGSYKGHSALTSQKTAFLKCINLHNLYECIIRLSDGLTASLTDWLHYSQTADRPTDSTTCWLVTNPLTTTRWLLTLTDWLYYLPTTDWPTDGLTLLLEKPPLV
jgi:hypothetical protein